MNLEDLTGNKVQWLQLVNNQVVGYQVVGHQVVGKWVECHQHLQVALPLQVEQKQHRVEQKQQHLPKILSTDVWWCQGYSEPGSGSDLASLALKAERDGDYYVLNGSKTWTTLAQWADWMFCLVRTSNEDIRQKGISFLLIDMKTPGISIRPIVTLDGPPEGEQEINETFFDNVRVPVANRIGKEGEGWTYAKYLLQFERGNAYAPGLSDQLKKVQIGRAHV